MIGNRLSALLFLLIIGFAALATWQWRARVAEPAPIAVAASPGVPLLPDSTPAPAAVPPLAELSQTLERPLFTRTRRPAPVEVAVTAPPPATVKAADPVPLAIELSAVILEADRQFALFRQIGQPALLRASVGERVDGWLVNEIRGDGVSLQRGSEKQELVLRTFKAPPLKPASRPPLRQPARAANQPASPAEVVRRPRRALRGPRRRSIKRQRERQRQLQQQQREDMTQQ